ncbi:GntR family transcriptional regulator [Alteribacillus bidgolensis]|uniref:DNA-binding transcriptional regulator, GntR family n=1 Tax=Alteribacillus bidgolensis TaxID=930129 RepID=A0A1G8KIW6_9BACI|nr:GntR family transcriptional regulator [Alteribacillus bidgolensis]SDI42810.1 DNA-binding transcriptional regulator, GntR family [Alteribacillus bidgolensis]
MSSIDLSNNALSNKIADHISKQIISGDLKAGEKIVENFYAEEYGTSRAPVREAIFLLTIEGLVERIPRKGAVVRGYTESEIYDLLEIRINLESLAMKRIIENGIDQNELAEMKKILTQMKNINDKEHYTQLNHSFHMCLLRMSESDIIKNTYARLEHPLLTVQNLSFSMEGNIEKSIQEHEKLIEWLEKNKLEKAASLLNTHNQYVIESIKKRLLEK